MFTRRYLKILGLFLFFTLPTAHAMVVKDLYSAQIPVTSQSEAVRSSGIKAAFLAVMVKVTGNSQATQAVDMSAAAASAENYVQQYSFETNPNANDSTHPYILQVDFAPNAINSFLLKENLPVWGQDRPLTLFWVVSAGQGHRALIGANSASDIATFIDKDADLRGIPGILPLLDLSDVKSVTPNDVMAPFLTTLQQASARYGSNAMVVVRVQHTATSIKTNWTLQVNGNTQNWQFQGTDLSKVISQGVNQVADALAGEFGVSDSMQQSEIELHISGLQSLSAFADAKKYLESLAPVKSASIDQISGDKVSFKVQLVGSIQDLQQAIRLDHVLRADANATDASTHANTGQAADQPLTILDFKWLR